MGEIFSSAAISVAIMLACAIPGFWFIKSKMLEEKHIAAFNKLLLYVAQPFLTINSFRGVHYTNELGINLLIFFALAVAVQLAVISLMYLIFRKKYDNVLFRISNIAMVFGNVGFFGIPLVESVLPNNPEAVMYASTFVIAMNILAWSLGSTIITLDKKHISFKKMFLNPAVWPIIIAIPMMMTNTEYPKHVGNMIVVFAKMTTVLSMLVMGMRLATKKDIKQLFNSPMQYLTIAVKQIVYPLFAMLLTAFLPIDIVIKKTVFILCSCPVASIVLNFSELHGQGQDRAANMMLLSTLSSLITIPLMILVLPAVYG